MESVAQICNMALSHLGVSYSIQDVDSELSTEAQACRLFYASCRDEVLRAFRWPFATVIETLALVEEEPNDEWAFSYRYPSACLDIRRILSGTRTDSRTTRVPYRVARDSTARLIFCDMEEAEVEYTQQVTNPTEFDPQFGLALSYLLASRIGPRVAGGDQFKLADRAYAHYRAAIAEAQNAAAREEQPDEPPDADMISARI